VFVARELNLITIAKTADDLAQVRSLFSEYASSIGIDLSFQNFDREFATLPGASMLPQAAAFY